MKKVTILITLIVAIFISSEVNAQMKIGNNPKVINPNSILEIEHTNKGLLLPRIELSSTISSAPMSAHLAGMIVYNTATTADVSPSFYYNDGTRWIRVGAFSSDSIAKYVKRSPIRDSIIKTIASNMTSSPLKDSIWSSITSQSKTLSNGNGILINGGNNLSKSVLADASLRIDSSAIAKMLVQSPVKDSISSTVMNLITNGSITGKTSTGGSLITVTNGAGAAIKDHTVSVDTTAMKTFVSTTINNSFTGQDLTAGSLLQTTGTPIGASLKTAGYQVDTTALKSFINGRMTHTISNLTNTITTTVNGVVATAPAVNTVSNASSGNNLSTTVNGLAGSNVNIINTNTFTGTSNVLTSTVNGVSATLTPNAGSITAKFLGFDASGNLVTDTADVSSDSWRDTTNLYTVTSRKIGIATDKPDTSAILDIAGTTGGVKFPTMTWTQVRSITLPAIGLRVFCSNLNTFLTNLGTPASPRWMAELTTDVDTVPGRLPVGTYRTAIGPTSSNVSLIFENLVFTALFSGGNNIPNVRTLTGTTTLLVWASSEWSTSAGSEHSVGSYAVGNGGQWTRNNLSISANTTNQSLHLGLSLAVQNMQSTETNSFIIFSTATNTLYKVNFYTYTVSSIDNTIIGVQKLR